MLLQTPVGAEGHLLGRILLTAAAPFQCLVDKASVTHHTLNGQAARILRADGHRAAATWATIYLAELNAGSDWADSGWKNSFHMYDPETGRGFKGWPSALDAVRHYHDLAVEQFRAGSLGEAFFHLGAAVHIVQDLCVPQHAAATTGENHRGFEQLALGLRDRFLVERGGLYDLGATPGAWVEANAQTSRPLLAAVGTGSNRSGWLRTVELMLPRAQQTTAGYLHYFLTQVEAVDAGWEEERACALTF